MINISNLVASVIAIAALCVTQPGQGQPVTWSQPQALNNYASNDGWQDTKPSVATDPNGAAVAVWLTPGGVAASRSADGGATWNQVYGSPVSAPGIYHDVDIAYTGQNTYVAMWIVATPVSQYQVESIRSTDGGQTWSVPTILHTGLTGLEIDLASDGAGGVLATFTSSLLRSANHGQTWSFTPPVFAEVYGHESSYSRVAHNGAGLWVHVYTQRVPGYFPGLFQSQSLHVGTSPDGINWSHKPIHSDNRADRPGAVEASGNTIVILHKSQVSYYSEASELVLFRSQDGGATWPFVTLESVPNGSDISISANGSRWLMLYDSHSELIYARISEDNMASWGALPWNGNTLPEGRPSAAALPLGRFLVAYDQYQKADPAAVGPDWDVKSHILNADNSWSADAFVNAGAATDIPALNDENVDIEMSSHCTAVAVWHVRDLSDAEVFFARSEDRGATWSNSAPISINYNSDSSNDLNPKVVYVGGTTWVAYWTGSEPAWSNYYTRSTDDGITWSAPAVLPVAAALDVSIGSNQNGILILSALDLAEKTTFWRSSNGGQTWDLVNTTGSYGEVTHSGGSSWFVTGNGNSTVTDDDGNTWEWVNTTPYLNGRAMNHFASDHQGTAMAIVADPPNFFSPELRVWIAVTRNNGKTWDFGDVYRQPWPSGQSVPSPINAKLAWAGDDKWIATWNNNDTITTAPPQPSGSRLFASISSTDGSAWSPAQRITTPVSSLPLELNHDIAASAGNIIVGWNTGPDQNTTATQLGRDLDILFTSSAVEVTEPGEPCVEVTTPPLAILQPQLRINLKFNKLEKDAAKLTGLLSIPSGFSTVGVPVSVDIGGVKRAFILDAKGKGRNGNASIKLSVKSRKGVVEAQEAKFVVTLKNDNLADSLMDEGLLNVDASNQPVQVQARLDFNGVLSIADIPLLYTAKQGKSGTAK